MPRRPSRGQGHPPVSCHLLPEGNQFYIPFDFELLKSHMSSVGDRLENELTFNDYGRVVQATGDSNASYTIENIWLEYDMVTQHRKVSRDKSDTLWNINRNVSARSMKGILMPFAKPAAACQRNTDVFYNIKITRSR